MEALLERKAVLRAALAEIGREKKAMARKVKSAEERRRTAWVLTPFVRDVVLIAYVLAGYTADPAAKYLATEARKRSWPSKSEEDLKKEAEDVFLRCEDMAELADLTCLTCPAHVGATKVAVRVVEEWRLAQWVARLNERQGVAPATSLVLERAEQARLLLPEALRPRPFGVATEAKARMRAMRWRRRHGGRHGRIRVREDTPLEERRAKAV